MARRPLNFPYENSHDRGFFEREIRWCPAQGSSQPLSAWRVEVRAGNDVRPLSLETMRTLDPCSAIRRLSFNSKSTVVRNALGLQ